MWSALGAQRFLRDRSKRRAKQREQVKAFRERYPDATILIERAAGGDGMIDELEGVRYIEGVAVGSTTGGTATRLENASPGIERGDVFLPLGMYDRAGFVEELAGASRTTATRTRARRRCTGSTSTAPARRPWRVRAYREFAQILLTRTYYGEPSEPRAAAAARPRHVHVRAERGVRLHARRPRSSLRCPMRGRRTAKSTRARASGRAYHAP